MWLHAYTPVIEARSERIQLHLERREQRWVLLGLCRNTAVQSLGALPAALHCYIVARVVQKGLVHSGAISPGTRATSFVDPNSPTSSTAITFTTGFVYVTAHNHDDS